MAVGRSRLNARIKRLDGCLMASVLVSWIMAAVATEELPEFLEQPQSQLVSQSSTVTLRCSATPEDARIRWLYDGQPLDVRRYKRLEVLGSSIEFVPNFGIDEDLSYGEYRCTATTGAGTVISQPAYLSKPALFRFTPVDDVTIMVPEGGYATLTCDPPRSSPSAHVVFQKSNGKLVDTSQGTVHQLPSGNLVLTNLTSAGADDFRCVAVNPVSGVNRTSPGATTLLIDRTLSNVGPTAYIMPGMRQKVQVDIGSDIVLECPSYGHQGAKITWSKYGGSLPVGRFSLSAFGNMKIMSARYEDAGTYTCSSATSGKMERHVFLDILVPPVIQVLRSPDAGVLPGSRVEMACSVAGYPKPELEWYHNGRLLVNNNEGQLVLTMISEIDAGIYQCMATNRLGSASGVIRLEVGQQTTKSTLPEPLLLVGDDEDIEPASGNGRIYDSRQEYVRRDRKKSERRKVDLARERRKKKKKSGVGGQAEREKTKYAPSVPTVAQLSDRSVMLNWSVTDKGNGQTIKFFKVQYKEVSPEKGPWRTSDAHLAYDARRFEVADLKSGGSYKFRILAVYEDDDNKNSKNTDTFKLLVQPHAQAKSPDTAPTIVEAKPVVYQQNYGIGVKWQYKAESASPIDGFVLFYKPFGASEDTEKIIPGSGIRNDVIRDLIPNTPYNIRMQSFNTAGRSQFSNQVVKTTKPRDSSLVENYPELELPMKEAEATTEAPVPDRRSSDSLENPVILGVVLGALLLALLILITMCWWKQRQQKRRSLAGCPQQKYQDQSRFIFADSNHHIKPNGTLYQANGVVPMANGHSSLLDGHRHVNTELNSLAEYDTQSGQGDIRTKLFYGNSINGMAPRFSPENGFIDNKFHHTEGNSHHGCNGDIPYMTQPKSLYSMQHCTMPHNSNTFYSEAGSLGRSVSHEYSEPGGRDPHSAATVLHSMYKQNMDHHDNGMGQIRNCDHNWPGSYDQPHAIRGLYTSLERLSSLYSPGSLDLNPETSGVCQQHGQHLLSSVPASQTGHVVVSNFLTVPGCLGPVEPGVHGNGKHKRKWKRPHSREPAHREHGMKDQATNTDISSNEGTLDFSTYCKSGSSSNSEAEIYGLNCDSSFANNGSLESVTKDSQSSSSSTSSHASDLHIATPTLPAPL